PATSKERFEECLAIVQQGLTQPNVTFEGRFFSFKDVPIELQPVQLPYPPLWYGANTPDQAERLARDGINAVIGLAPGKVNSFVDRYRATWRDMGREDKDLPFLGMSRHIVV